MKAAVYYGRGDVRVEEVPEPITVADDQVRVRILRAGLCGTDVAEYMHGPTLIPVSHRHSGSGHRGPTVIGHEMLGRVEAVGAAVSSLSVGQRVVAGAGGWCGNCSWCQAGRTNLCERYYTLGLSTHGGMAELINLPAAMCLGVPQGCSDDVAAMAQPLAVALHAVRRAGIGRDDLVVLIGVGGIGFFLLMGLVSRGVRVIAVDIDPGRRALAERHGAVETIDGLAPDAAAHDIASGGLVDAAFEASGAPTAPALAQRIVRRGGRIVLIGLQQARRPVDLADLVLREIDVVTSNAHVCDTDLPEALNVLSDQPSAMGAVERVIALEAIVESGLEPLSTGDVRGKVLVDPSAGSGT